MPKCCTSVKYTTMKSSVTYLRKGGLILNPSLDLQKHARLPIIQLCDLIKLDDSAGEHLGIALLESLDEKIDKFGFSCG
jgi:hypothetical protein